MSTLPKDKSVLQCQNIRYRKRIRRKYTNKAKPKMSKRWRSMPTLELICVCQGANCFHSLISWHLLDMFPLH